MIPAPCQSLILLFPSSVKTALTSPTSSQTAAGTQPFFLEQIPELDDACGTIAVVRH